MLQLSWGPYMFGLVLLMPCNWRDVCHVWNVMAVRAHQMSSLSRCSSCRQSNQAVTLYRLSVKCEMLCCHMSSVLSLYMYTCDAIHISSYEVLGFAVLTAEGSHAGAPCGQSTPAMTEAAERLHALLCRGHGMSRNKSSLLEASPSWRIIIYSII